MQITGKKSMTIIIIFHSFYRNKKLEVANFKINDF